MEVRLQYPAVEVVEAGRVKIVIQTGSGWVEMAVMDLMEQVGPVGEVKEIMRVTLPGPVPVGAVGPGVILLALLGATAATAACRVVLAVVGEVLLKQTPVTEGTEQEERFEYTGLPKRKRPGFFSRIYCRVSPRLLPR